MVPRQDTEEVRYHRGRVGEEERRETRSTTLQRITPKRKARRRLRMQQRPHRTHNRHLNQLPSKSLGGFNPSGVPILVGNVGSTSTGVRFHLQSRRSLSEVSFNLFALRVLIFFTIPRRRSAS